MTAMLDGLKRSIAREMMAAGPYLYDPVVFIKLSLAKTVEEALDIANSHGLMVGFVVVRQHDPIAFQVQH